MSSVLSLSGASQDTVQLSGLDILYGGGDEGSRRLSDDSTCDGVIKVTIVPASQLTRRTRRLALTRISLSQVGGNVTLRIENSQLETESSDASTRGGICAAGSAKVYITSSQISDDTAQDASSPASRAGLLVHDDAQAMPQLNSLLLFDCSAYFLECVFAGLGTCSLF